MYNIAFYSWSIALIAPTDALCGPLEEDSGDTMPKTPPEIKLFILLGSFLIAIIIILVMLDEKNLKGEEETGDVYDGYWVYPFDSGNLSVQCLILEFDQSSLSPKLM